MSWTTWAHLIARPVIGGVRRRGFPWDLSWGGPYWIPAVRLPSVSRWLVLPGALVVVFVVYRAVLALWGPMQRAADPQRR